MLEIINEPVVKKLIPTSTFSPTAYSYKDFNHLQTIYYPHYNQDKNIVICASTSSGKTICAELSADDTIQKGKKTIFLCPLKALSQEKLDTWTHPTHHLSKYKIEILTGDNKINEAKVKALKEADLIIMTSEMLDTRTRFHTSEANSWLADVGLVITDEAHLLTTNRGPALEVGLMKFTEINPSAKLLFLSATMGNSEEIGRWVESLNNKLTCVIKTSWRPVSLNITSIPSKASTALKAVEILKILTCKSSELACYLVGNNKLERDVATNRMIGGPENIKTLAFVHTKNDGRKLEELLINEGISAKFHNADLDKNARLKLEKSFKEELDVLISTSTLAWGVNLPARNTIILGDRRGSETVSSIDITQMAGRAGRFGMYDRGDVYLINCEMEKNFKVESQLAKQLPFHIVAEIYSGNIKQKADALKWSKRSFKYFDNKSKADQEIENTLSALLTYNCIKVNKEGDYETTHIGKIARDLYLDPIDVAKWDINFKKVNNDKGWDSALDVARAITNEINLLSNKWTPAPLTQFVNSFKTSLSFSNLSYATPGHVQGSLIYYRLTKEDAKMDKYMIAGLEAAYAPHFQLLMKENGRIFSAIKRLSSYNKWKKEDELEVLQARIIHGVGKHLVDLVSIPGVGGVIAHQLYAAGLKTKADVIKNQANLGKYIERKANVTRILNGLKELSTSSSSEDDDLFL